MEGYDLPVSATCLWYPHADTNQEPYAAIVTETDGRGCISLQIFPRHGQMFFKKGVRHVSDPVLRERPTLRENKGGWEFGAKVHYPKKTEAVKA